MPLSLFVATVVFTGEGQEAWWPVLGTAHVLAGVLFAVVVIAWGRHGSRGLLVSSAVVAVLAVAAAFTWSLRPSDIPIDWITIIHEGLGHQSIRQIYARGAHAGVNFSFVVESVAAGQVPNLHDVVWLNLLLALVNAAIFLHLALTVTTIGWAVVWTLVFALNPVLFLASFSELPTNLLALYFLAGAVAWVTLNDTQPQPRMIRAAAFALCALLTGLVLLTRPEVAFVGVVALAVYSVHAIAGEDRWAAAAQRLGDACQRAFRFLADRPAAIAALAAVGFWVSWAGLPWDVIGRSEAAGLYPFNPSILALFFYLPMILLPVGVSVAVFFGFVHSAIHFRRFGGLALSLFVLVRMYFAAQNQFHETGRYLSYVLPAIFLLGLFGKRQFDELGQRWSPNWYRAAVVLYFMLWFSRPLPGTPDFFTRPEYHRDAGFSQIMLDLNMQREVRHLLTVTERNPECVFVGRVIESYANPDRPLEYAYAVFGASVPNPIFVSEKEMALEDVIARYASGASCVRLYYGGDCNLTHADHCERFVAGRRLIDEERFWSRVYNNPPDFGYAAPEVVLATYAWP